MGFTVSSPVPGVGGAPALAPRDDSAIRVLVVDDEPAMRKALARSLGARGMSTDLARDGGTALAMVEAHEYDVVLLDLLLPDLHGLAVLERIRNLVPHLQVVIMTAHADIPTALQSIQRGAYHFLTKPFRSDDEVFITLRNAAECRRQELRTLELERQVLGEASIEDFWGNSRAMRRVYERLMAVARSHSTVLLQGESGTGKELTARAIHRHSLRADKPLVTVNCSAIPPDLLESELFGHVKGAFTGATTSRKGLFEAADTGTLFLDEVGDLPLHAQVKILRVLQDGELKPVGSNEVRRVDVRVLCATHLDLHAMIRAGTFREDLYYRLAVVTLQLPPLRERAEDIVSLAQRFLVRACAKTGKSVKRLSPAALDALTRHSWPGNVRELENAVEHGVIFATGDEVTPADLPATVAGVPSAGRPGPGRPAREALELPYREARARAMEEFEQRYFNALLTRADGNLAEAARLAGVDRSNLKRLLRRARMR